MTAFLVGVHLIESWYNWAGKKEGLMLFVGVVIMRDMDFLIRLVSGEIQDRWLSSVNFDSIFNAATLLGPH